MTTSSQIDYRVEWMQRVNDEFNKINNLLSKIYNQNMDLDVIGQINIEQMIMLNLKLLDRIKESKQKSSNNNLPKQEEDKNKDNN